VSYQKANSRLLIRPKVNSSESLQSYLIRLSRANGYKYPAFSSGITAQSKPHRSFKLEDRKEIQSLISNIADSNVHELVDVWECGHSFKHLFDYSRIKSCPKCLEQENILLPYWSLKNYLVCTKHKVLLIDSCSRCDVRFEEQSYVKGHCIKCKLEIQENRIDYVKLGSFDQKIHDKLLEFSIDSGRFRKILSEDIECIYVNYQICSYLIKGLENKSKYISLRRTLSIASLYEAQKEIQQIIDEGKVSKLLLDSLFEYRNTTSKGISSFITPVFKILMSQHGSLYKAELINMLITAPNGLGDWPVGLNWVEKLLLIKANDLKVFAKENFPNIEVKCQGPFTVLIRDLNFLLSEYSKHSTDFKLS